MEPNTAQCPKTGSAHSDPASGLTLVSPSLPSFQTQASSVRHRPLSQFGSEWPPYLPFSRRAMEEDGLHDTVQEDNLWL